MTGDDETLPDQGDQDEAPQSVGTVDVSTPRALAKARKTTKKAETRSREFWQRILADEVGREEIWKLLTGCHTFAPRFGVGPTGFPQPEASWFHAGEQAVGLRLYQSLLVIDMENVRQMHLEFDTRFPKVEK